MLNVQLLLKELRFLTIHPESWNQEYWVEAKTRGGYMSADAATNSRIQPSACGTYGGLAGNVVLHEGYELRWTSSHIERNPDGSWSKIWFSHYINDEEYTPIKDKAQELLGLTERQAEALFMSANTEQDMWRIADEITAGEIGPLLYSEAIALRDLARRG